MYKHVMKPIVFLQFNTKILSFLDTCSPTEKIIKFKYNTLEKLSLIHSLLELHLFNHVYVLMCPTSVSAWSPHPLIARVTVLGTTNASAGNHIQVLWKRHVSS